jgi:hypothetical protein
MKLLGIRGLMLIHTMTVLLGKSAPPSRDAEKPAARTGSGVLRGADHPERGDVPGWVMITLMSAVLVAALLALAGPALEALFNQAMDKVGK